MSAHNRYWSWPLSAPFYRFTYLRIAHQLDEDLFAYLGDLVQGAVVADCGCGPGIVAEKFLQHGAASVFAIDVNASMLAQAQNRLAAAIAEKQVELVHATFQPVLFSSLADQQKRRKPFNIILFKRSLYHQRAQAVKILRAAGAQIAPGGVLALVHPARSLARYAFSQAYGFTPYTIYHLFNRLISRLAVRVGISSYTLYRQDELFELLQSVVPSWNVEWIPSQQSAYHLIAARAADPSDSTRLSRPPLNKAVPLE
jgi:SAM-dependent methyltransferase